MRPVLISELDASQRASAPEAVNLSSTSSVIVTPEGIEATWDVETDLICHRYRERVSRHLASRGFAFVELPAGDLLFSKRRAGHRILVTVRPVSGGHYEARFLASPL